MDQFRKSKEEKKEHSTPPAKGFTLAEILNDGKSFHLFGKILEKEGDKELAQKIAEGKIEEGDIELLEQARLKYQEKVQVSEGVENLLTEETIVEIARNHPDFEKIVNLVGPKKAISAIKSQLREICITDEARFDTIAEPLKNHDSYKKGEFKKTELAVEKMCKDKGISPKAYLEALAIEDPEEKQTALKKLVKEKYGKFEKGINFLSLGALTRSGMDDLKAGEASLEEALAEMNAHQEAIGDALFASVSGNEDMRNALARELISEKAPKVEPEVGFGDAKKEVIGAFTDAACDKDWEDLKVKTGYDSQDDLGQDVIKDEFINAQKEKYKKKGPASKGFWASIFAALFEKKIENKKDTLK